MRDKIPCMLSIRVEIAYNLANWIKTCCIYRSYTVSIFSIKTFILKYGMNETAALCSIIPALVSHVSFIVYPLIGVSLMAAYYNRI